MLRKNGKPSILPFWAADRFSEDIDPTYIRRLIPNLIKGYGFLPSNRSQTSKWTRTVRECLPEWIATNAPRPRSRALARDQLQARLEVDGDENDKSLLVHPALKPSSSYARTVVTLEFGGRATGEPNQATASCLRRGWACPGCFISDRPARDHGRGVHLLEKGDHGDVYSAQRRIRGERCARHWRDLAAISHRRFRDDDVTGRAAAAAIAYHKALFFLEKDANGVIDFKSA